MFFIGWHISTGGQVTRTGTVVIKRTYIIDADTAVPANGSLTPDEEPLPIFEADELETVIVDAEEVEQIVYEHDLMPEKPESDYVVRLTTNNLPNSLTMNGATILQRPAAIPELDYFEWEARDSAVRGPMAPFPDDPNAYPLDPPLPVGFDNRFYNGYRRDARVGSLAYIPNSAKINLSREGISNYGFTLHGETLHATYAVYRGVGDDDESHWRRFHIPLNLDTLVIEPDDDRCYTVWRGVWEFDQHPEDAYRRLTVSTN